MRISDWRSDVCSSDLAVAFLAVHRHEEGRVAVLRRRVGAVLEDAAVAAVRRVVLDIAGRRARAIGDMRRPKAVHVARRRLQYLGLLANGSVAKRAPVGVGPGATGGAKTLGVWIRVAGRTRGGPLERRP